MGHLGDVLGAYCAELGCFHDHDGVVVEPLDDILVDDVLILSLQEPREYTDSYMTRKYGQVQEAQIGRKKENKNGTCSPGGRGVSSTKIVVVVIDFFMNT